MNWSGMYGWSYHPKRQFESKIKCVSVNCEAL